jgi:hypothetical protein
MALASHSGSCDGCGDQCGRQKVKIGHLVSPFDMKSQQRVAPLWKWSSDRPIKVTFPHVVSTPREVGRVGTIILPVRAPQDEVSFVKPDLMGRDRCRLTSGLRHPSTRMLANEKLAPQRARPVDEPLFLLRPRILASVDTGKSTMTLFKTLAAATLLSAVTLTPVFAQAAIPEPGLFAFYHPNADVLNGGAPTPEAALASAPACGQRGLCSDGKRQGHFLRPALSLLRCRVRQLPWP